MIISLIILLTLQCFTLNFSIIDSSLPKDLIAEALSTARKHSQQLRRQNEQIPSGTIDTRSRFGTTFSTHREVVIGRDMEVYADDLLTPTYEDGDIDDYDKSFLMVILSPREQSSALALAGAIRTVHSTISIIVYFNDSSIPEIKVSGV